MKSPPALKRRCWRCTDWIELDPFNPDDQERRYCSPDCERKDQAEIARTERVALRELARTQEGLLLEKGILTVEEYYRALADKMEEEVQSYAEKLPGNVKLA